MALLLVEVVGILLELLSVQVKESMYVLLPGGTIIGWLSKGNRFEVDGTKSGEWVHVKVAGIGIGYMHQNYVSYDNGNLY